VEEHFGWKASYSDNFASEWDLWWADYGVDSEMLSQLKPYQKINHFPVMYKIARKNYLARNLRKLQKLFPDEYGFFPRTWILPFDLAELRLAAAQ